MSVIGDRTLWYAAKKVLLSHLSSFSRVIIWYTFECKIYCIQTMVRSSIGTVTKTRCTNGNLLTLSSSLVVVTCIITRVAHSW